MLLSIDGIKPEQARGKDFILFPKTDETGDPFGAVGIRLKNPETGETQELTDTYKRGKDARQAIKKRFGPDVSVWEEIGVDLTAEKKDDLDRLRQQYRR